MITENYYDSNEDLQFNLDHFIDWENVVKLKEHNFRDAARFQESQDTRFEMAPGNVEDAVEAYKIICQQYGEICGKQVAPSAADMDREGLRFEAGKVLFPKKMEELVDLMMSVGLIGFATEREYGGLFLPLTVQSVLSELLSRADASLAVTLGCYSLAEVIGRYGDSKMKEQYLPKMSSGEICGAMALTEADHGSDLSNLLTKAEPTSEEGIFEITGSKRFITHACGFGKYPSAVLTLARSKGNGAKGLSLFVVDSKDIEVSRIEEKIGLHCSPTCEIVYEKSRALLIGEEGRGLVKYGMEMMNGARLAVGVQGLGIAEAAHQESYKYASERIQFGKPIKDLPAVRRQLNHITAYVHAMRAIIYRTSVFVDLLDGNREKLEEEGIEKNSMRKHPDIIRWEKLSKLHTPIAKMFCSEESNRVVTQALQIFGGSGYTEEYDIARIYRDARITTIYEGTTNLQIVAAIGGIIEGLRDSGELNKYLSEELEKVDIEDQSRIKAFKDDLVAMVGFYKGLEREQKEATASDLVYAYSYFFASLLLSQQKRIAKEVNHSIKDQKILVTNTFLSIATAKIAAHKISLEYFK